MVLARGKGMELKNVPHVTNASTGQKRPAFDVDVHIIT